MSQDYFEAGPVAPKKKDEDPLYPPIEPPSAGFFVQLFVVPALIVLAVVGVWALFGKIASSEEDWRELVEDIRNTNENRRWRGAYGLAMLLDRDQQLGESGQQLAKNTEIARVLVGLLDEGLKRHSQREDDLKQEAFLARTLGLLDSPATVLPALENGMKPDQDREIRKNAIAAIAVIAERAGSNQDAAEFAPVTADLIAATSDSDPLIRDISTYALGLLSNTPSRDRLTTLVGSGDANTRINAAVALARQKSTAGLPVFKSVLAGAAKPQADASSSGSAETVLALKNALHAVRLLADEWTAPQRTELIALIEPLSTNHAEPRIRTDAIESLIALRKK